MLMPACRDDAVVLAYRFEERSVVTYRMLARADASWNIESPGTGSYEASFEVTETVTSVDDDGAVVEVTMTPTAIEEHGLPSPGLERRTFSLRLGAGGEVVEVLEVDDVVARALDQEEIAFIGTYRPSLPSGEVRLRQEWSAERDIRLGTSVRSLATTGELVAFRQQGGRSLARLGFTGESPLEWVMELPQGETELTGHAEMHGDGLFDITGGFLEQATSATRGHFDVRVLPEGGQAPITGTLELDLELTVQRQT